MLGGEKLLRQSAADEEASTNSDAAYRFRHEYTIVSTSYGEWRPGVRGGTDIGPSELTLNQSISSGF